MTKYLLISIQPQHVYNILIGKKTLELRKSVPKNFEGWVYIYCTKTKPYLYDRLSNDYKWALDMKEYQGRIPHKYELNSSEYFNQFDRLNGTVVARFWFDEYDKLLYVKDRFYERSYEWCYKKQRKSCLTDEQIHLYGKGKDLYAWHINKLEVFDKPMFLSELYGDFAFSDTDEYGRQHTPFHIPIPLKRPPQSWMYVCIK